MLTITRAAKQEIIRFAQEELFDGEFIRIARAYQCGGPRFQLTVDDVKTSMDRVVTLDGEIVAEEAQIGGSAAIVIDAACLQLLENMQIDFVESGFVFDDPVEAVC